MVNTELENGLELWGKYVLWLAREEEEVGLIKQKEFVLIFLRQSTIKLKPPTAWSKWK